MTLAAQAAIAAGGLILYRLLATEKGASAMASYGLVKQLTSFLLPVAMVGLQTGVPRYVALARDRRGEPESYLLSALGMAAISTGVIVLVLLSAKGTAASVLFGRSDRTYLVGPLALTLAATLTFEIAYGYYRGRARFLIANIARALGVASFPIVLLLVIPRRPIGELISLMALGALVPGVVLAIGGVARSRSSTRPRSLVSHAKTLLNYGARRIPGEYAGLILLTVPPVIAAHVAPLHKVAWLTAGMYVVTMITIAFNPVGVVFLPLLARLQGEDIELARVWVRRLAACALHVAVFVTPQLLLFADVAMRAWLGPGFNGAGWIIRITVLPMALYIFVLVLRSALDAAAVKAYNARNALVALSVAAVSVTAGLSLDIGDPIVAIAASYALGMTAFGASTIVTIHRLYRIGFAQYALGTALALSAAVALPAAAVRFLVVGYPASLWAIGGALVMELALAALYVAGLTKSGVTWPSDIRGRLRAARG